VIIIISILLIFLYPLLLQHRFIARKQNSRFPLRLSPL
jgi:hypothetical protein